MGLTEKVFRQIKSADIIIEVVDARFPEETRVRILEGTVHKMGKKLIIVANKSDLVDKKLIEKWKRQLEKMAHSCVFVSAKKRFGTAILRKEIKKLAGNKRVSVAVVGFPNTGKSSVINALVGRKIARTGSYSGFTKGKQWIKLDNSIRLIDTPGEIPFKGGETYLALIGAYNPEQLKEPELVCEKLLEKMMKEDPKSLEKNFGVLSEEKKPHEILEEIALKKKRLLKGGIPDTKTIAKIILKDWQTGKILI
jgi:hypothetical protein